MDQETQDFSKRDTRARGRDALMVALAVIGAICVLPVVAAFLGGLVKLFVGLAAGFIGLVFGMVSLVIGLAHGAAGLVLGLFGAIAGFLVTPPGLVLLALIVYLSQRQR